MLMKKYYLFLIIVLGAMIMSCHKTEYETTRDDSTIVTLDAITSSTNSSRSSLDGIAFSWISGDKLGVYNGSTDNNSFTTTESGATVSFTGSLTSASNYVYAVYPYVNGSGKFANDKYTFNLDQAQAQNHNTDGSIDIKSLGNHTFLYGQTQSIWEQTDKISMNMSHLSTIFDFVVYDIPSGTKVTSLALSSSSTDNFISTAEVAFSQTDSFTPTYELGTAKHNAITVNLDTEGVSGVTIGAANSLTVRLVMLPQDITAATSWTITLKTDGADIVYTKTFANAVTIKPGSRYNVSLMLNATTKAIVLGGESGSLEAQLAGSNSSVTSLTLSGTASDDDLNFMLTLPAIIHLDLANLTNTTIPIFFNTALNQNLESIKLPNQMVQILGAAFKNGTKLKLVETPATLLRAISSSAFEGCTSLVNVIFRDHPDFEYLGNNTFTGCTSLATITLPEGLKSIYQNAFKGSGLTSIVFPASLTEINTAAFSACLSLKELTFLSDTPPTFKYGSWNNLFAAGTNITKVYVPYGKKSIYLENSDYSTWTDKMVELPQQ